MRIYRVELFSEADSSRGSEFFGSMREAKRRLAEWRRQAEDDYDDRTDITAIDVTMTKAGVLAFANRWAGDPSNG